MKQKREEMRMYTILIIEDDEAICRELQMLLQKQGYEAICWNMQEDSDTCWIRKSFSTDSLLA